MARTNSPNSGGAFHRPSQNVRRSPISGPRDAVFRSVDVDGRFSGVQASQPSVLYTVEYGIGVAGRLSDSLESTVQLSRGCEALIARTDRILPSRSGWVFGAGGV